LTCQAPFDKIQSMEIPEQYEVLDPDALARQLGYTRSTVYTHLSRERWDKIPPPSVRLAMGPVWYVGDVEEWQQAEKGDIRGS
jgi:predicted DNA-binding transcriptional regulator AlpA